MLDLTDVDLGRDVTINPNHIDVYPDDFHKPEVGHKLNKPALITLVGGMRPKKAMSCTEYEAHLKS